MRARIGMRLGAARDLPFYVAPLNTVIEADTDPDRLRLEDPAALLRLANTIKGERLDLAILDTLRELHDQPENDSDAMGPLLRPIRQIAHETNCTILTNHHMNRANGSRGSTAIKAAMDLEWAFVRTDDPDNATARRRGGWWWRAAGRGRRCGSSSAPTTTCAGASAGRRRALVPSSVRDHILGWLDRCGAGRRRGRSRPPSASRPTP